MTHRDDLYPLGMSKRGCTLGPKSQPKPRNPYREEIKAQALCALIVLGILAWIFLAGRGGN